MHKLTLSVILAVALTACGTKSVEKKCVGEACGPGDNWDLKSDASTADVTSPDGGFVETDASTVDSARALPCIELEPIAVYFGVVDFATTATATVDIHNCAPDVDLVVDDVTIFCEPDGPGCLADSFALADIDALSFPLTIAPGATTSLEVTYAPLTHGPHSGRLVVDSDARTVELALGGDTPDVTCRTDLVPVAGARVGGAIAWVTEIDTIPMNTVEFTAADSTGAVAAWEWSAGVPTGSTARFTPNAVVDSPALFLDLAGDYTVELQVFDELGVPSCSDPSVIMIHVLAGGDIVIQLTWDTPADNNQTDTFGTDIDLHFLHPNGTWNNAPYDIYWLNPTAEWGNPGPSDDPTLDLDDTDGAGPEQISFSDPQAGLTYAIGGYYYADNGYGPSYGTLQVYVGGVLTYEYLNIFLSTTGTFWYAATITWPAGTVVGINNVQQGFPPP